MEGIYLFCPLPLIPVRLTPSLGAFGLSESQPHFSFKGICWSALGIEAIFLALFSLLIPLAPRLTADSIERIHLQRIFMSLFFATLLISITLYGIICFIYIRKLIAEVKAAPESHYLTSQRSLPFPLTLNSFPLPSTLLFFLQL